MIVAVTGATGFLGHYVVNRLLSAGHTCRCWYRTGSDREGFVEAGGQLEWIAGELGDAQAGAELAAGADAVVHGGLARSANAVEYANVNLLGSVQLMQQVRDAGVERCVFISTCAVHERILDDRPLDEAHPLWPSGHYGAYKAAVEKFVHSYGLGEGWAVCSLRPTGIYGLTRPIERSKWFALIGQVIAGRPLQLSAGGKEVHAADVAKAVEVLLNADAAAIGGEAFNCYDMYIAQQDIAEIAAAITGAAGGIEKLNRGCKHQISTKKIEALGMKFGGRKLLEQTVGQLVDAMGGQKR